MPTSSDNKAIFYFVGVFSAMKLSFIRLCETHHQSWLRYKMRMQRLKASGQKCMSHPVHAPFVEKSSV